jgi:lipoate-protein ligase A
VQKWTQERVNGNVRDLHALGIPPLPQRVVRWCDPTDAALVLGSAQKQTDVDLEAVQLAGLDLVRRRSGGGAVLVEAEDLVWVDIILPKHDPLWREDVGTAFHWLGHVWRDALESLGVEGVGVHEGPMISTEWSRQICFAGLGPGECLVDDRKVVGISQKRTREGAIFQCSLVRRFDAVKIAGLLALSADDRRNALHALNRTVGAVALSRDAIEREFAKSLEKTAV